jgi:hypothetical protein
VFAAEDESPHRLKPILQLPVGTREAANAVPAFCPLRPSVTKKQ